MSTDPELPDDVPDGLPLESTSWDEADEARVAWLMTSAQHAPAMREDFSRELAARMDAEFSTLHGTLKLNGHALNGRVVNGHAPAGEARGTDVRVVDVRATDVEPAVVPYRPWRRWVVGVSAAASLL